MIMENPESILEELEKFEKKTGDGASKMLEDYVHHIAKTGDTIFPWHRIRHFMQHMLETVMNEFYETCGGEDMTESGNVPAFSFTTTRDKLLHHFDTFTGAPFTIQRLCEIMVDPTRHYRRTDKFLRGLEKNVLVVSSVEPGRQRRSEDQQHTLVNGLQEGGLHTNPLSGSPLPGLPHHPKRLSPTQATNSILNNTNDSYNADMNDSENQVTISEANGPSGPHREEQHGSSSPTDTSEPPTKKIRLEETFEEREGESSSVELPQSPVKSSTSSTQEGAEVEASRSREETDAEGEAEAEAAKMETEEAEATCSLGDSNDKEPRTPQEGEEQQVATSNTGTAPQDPPKEVGCQDDDAQQEQQQQEQGEEEDEDEEGTAKSGQEPLSSVVSPEVCSSNSPNTSSPPKAEESGEAERVLVVFSSARNSEGSPDCGEGPAAWDQPRDQPDTHKEREGSSEAAAAEDENNRTKSPSAPEGSVPAEDSSRNSHEADSTSQAHSSSNLPSQTAHTDAAVETEVDSAVSSPPPVAKDHSPTAAAVGSPTPSNSSSLYPTSDTTPTAAAHTTSQTSSSSSSSSTTSSTTTTSTTTTTTITTTATTSHGSNSCCTSASPDSEMPEPAPAPDTESAAAAATSTTTSLPQGLEQEGASCDKRTLTSISCSSSQQSEPDHQPTEEE